MNSEDKDILKRAIKKAESQGFFMKDWVINQWERGKTFNTEKAPYELLFNHDFCRALFGTKPMYMNDFKNPAIKIQTETWKFHIQQVALNEEPLQYIKKFI